MNRARDEAASRARPAGEGYAPSFIRPPKASELENSDYEISFATRTRGAFEERQAAFRRFAGFLDPLAARLRPPSTTRSPPLTLRSSGF